MLGAAQGLRMALTLCLSAGPLRLRGGSNDGEMMRGGSEEGELMQPSRSFLGHNGTVLALAYHEGILYSGGLDCIVRLWDVKMGKCIAELETSQSDSCAILSPSVSSIAVNNDNIWLGTIASSLEKWDTETRMRISFVGCAEDKRCKMEDMHKGSIDVLLLKEDPHATTMLLSGAADGMIRLWDADTDQALGVLEGHTDAIYALAETVDPCPYIVSGSNDGTIRVWSLQSRKCLTVLETDDFEDLPALSLASLGSSLMAGTIDGIIQTWNMNDWNMAHEFVGHCDSVVGAGERSFSRQTPVNSLWMAKSLGVLVSASADWLVRLWKPGTDFCIMTCRGHQCNIFALTGGWWGGGRELTVGIRS
eukprot:766819-Hanusia_phi.AAC.4